MAAEADIEYAQRLNPTTQRMQDCVIATCCDSGEASEPIWGHTTASVKRALASLKDCDCGQSFHKGSKGEDDD